MTLLLTMAIWTIGIAGVGSRFSITSSIQKDESEDVRIESVANPSEELPGESGTGPDLLTTSNLIADFKPTLDRDGVGEPSAQPVSLSDSIRQSGKDGVKSAFVGMSIEARSPKNRSEAAAKNGGSQESEQAVEAALDYFARHQRNDGSWTAIFEQGPCQGECDHSGITKDPHEIASTGLALMCFLGAGHTMTEGKYSEQVNRGVYYLIQRLKIEYGRGSWLTSAAASEMYEHGIASLALCEALQMKGDASIKDACQASINFIVYAQHNDGGWDYHPKSPGDLSIVGWQVMALKSAVAANLQVPPETIRGIDLFLFRHAVGEFMFRYRNRGKPTDSMTAIGNLLRLFRGTSKTNPVLLKAVDHLVDEGPSAKDAYYNYYATQLIFQFGGMKWEKWNGKLRDYLVRTQSRTGHDAGSWWLGSDISNDTGGRLYVTAMACLTLEVYYRYLPVYEETSEEFKL
jgi:hypothetical protein